MLSKNALSLQTTQTLYYDLVDQFSIEYKVNYPNDPSVDFIHYHECFEIVLYIQSDNIIYVDDEKHALQTHDLLLIPPQRIHMLCYNANATYCRYVMYFTTEHILQAFSADQGQKALALFRDAKVHKITLSLDAFSRLNSVFKNMAHHSHHHKDTQMPLIESYSRVILEEIYYILQKKPPQAQSTEKKNSVEKILQYINAHYAEQIVLEDLARELFLNKFYLCRLFRESMNSSIVDYLQFKRVIEAEKLLNNTDLPILDICFECGFHNLQHFYRTFKKYTSLTPKQFRSDNRVSFTQSIKRK